MGIKFIRMPRRNPARHIPFIFPACISKAFFKAFLLHDREVEHIGNGEDDKENKDCPRVEQERFSGLHDEHTGNHWVTDMAVRPSYSWRVSKGA